MIEKFFTALLPSIEHIHPLGYWVAFAAALLETALVVGLFVPGSTFLLLLGALAASGSLDFGDLVWFAVAGAFLGDNLNYWLGKRYGTTWTRDGVWFLTPDHFVYARRFFDRHGERSVFLGRFIPSVKEIVPFVAGTVGMRQRTFMLWNVLGAVGWGMLWVGGGYLFGQSLRLAQTWMSRAEMVLLVVLVAGLLLWLIQRLVLRHGRTAWQVVVSLGRSLKEALGHNPYVRRLVRRHPNSIRILTGRIDRAHFYGLPLTLLALAFVAVLALFAGIVEDVVTSDPIVALDHAASQLIAVFRDPAIIPPFARVTILGTPPVVGGLLVVACLLLWLVRRTVAAAGLLLSTLGASAFCLLGKLAFQRPRPLEAVVLESSFSFPSGHATVAIAFYGFLGYLLIRSTSRWNLRVYLFFATAALVLLIGLSRIMLNVHYLSDVWAGYLVGALWLIIGISLNEWLVANGSIVWKVPGERRRSVLAFGLAAVAIAGVIGYVSSRTLPAQVSRTETLVQIDRPVVDVLQADKLSWTTTLLGTPEQPISFVVIAPDENGLVAHLQQNGWLAVDRPALRNMLRLVREGLDDTTAPLAPSFWNGRVNDRAFARSAQRMQGKALATVRIWRTSLRVEQDVVFVGVAREYGGIRWGVLHTVSPDVDAAADDFVASLSAPGDGVAACRQQLVPPVIGAFLLGDRFFSRGQIWLVDLGSASAIARRCAPDRTTP